jgi:hypothetical protein
VYDVRKSEALTTFNLDISNGALTMHLDVDTGVLFLAGKVRVFAWAWLLLV